MAELPDDWEMVVGLEVHTELATATKLFCGCSNAFGGEPNTNVCPVCLGLPGSLPVLNEKAVELAIRIGLALHCEIAPSVFARKNYFYPDQPKDYQISQYDKPLNGIGHLDLPDGTRVVVERAHMEEDTGKTTHLGGTGLIHGADESIVDYNRAWVPLVEIVSGPDIRSAEQARLYAAELRAILIATGASDGRMEEGSMRVDANVSVRRGPDAPFGTRCEIKNLNSLRSVQRAIDHEAMRQVLLLEAGESIVQETRHWDEDAGRTQTLRSKEEAYDYRYFPEPDLVPLAPPTEQIDAIRASLPEMPAERRRTLVALLGDTATPAHADQIASVVDQGLDAFVTAATAAGVAAPLALARVANELAGALGDGGVVSTDAMVVLLQMEEAGEVSATQAKSVLAELVATDGVDPRAVARAKGFEQMDTGALEAVLDEVIAQNADAWQRYVDGDDKVAGFFTGKVMAATKGQADGKAVNAGLRQRRG